MLVRDMHAHPPMTGTMIGRVNQKPLTVSMNMIRNSSEERTTTNDEGYTNSTNSRERLKNLKLSDEKMANIKSTVFLQLQ